MATPFCPIPFNITVSDIASGDNHMLILSDDGRVFSFGVAEQGQLGRVRKDDAKFAISKKDTFLKPQQVVVEGKPDIKFDRVWAGNLTSFARTQQGRIYAWGLNNYSQLGFKPSNTTNVVEWYPVDVTDHFPPGVTIQEMCSGQHHTLALTTSGKLFSFGRHHYGRLGHGELEEDQSTPRLIEALQDKTVVGISCGMDSCFAVTADRECHADGCVAAK